MSRHGARREELLRLAQGLWLERGYAGWSYADLSRASGIRKASVHHHFATKEQLVGALIERMGAQAGAWAAGVAALPAPAALNAFLEVYEGLLAEPTRICPAGAISADLAVLPEGLVVAGQRYLAAQRSWLLATLRRGPWQDQPAEDLASAILGALQGSLQRARTVGDPAALRGTVRMLRRWLGLPMPSD